MRFLFLFFNIIKIQYEEVRKTIISKIYRFLCEKSFIGKKEILYCPNVSIMQPNIHFPKITKNWHTPRIRRATKNPAKSCLSYNLFKIDF